MTFPPPRRDRRTAVQDAFAAVRANCAGKSRKEVEQLLRDELTGRGAEFPESLIRASADVLARPRGLPGQLRMLRFGLRALTATASEANAISRILSGADPGIGAIKDPADPASSWADVILDGEGKSALRTRRERLGLLTGVRDQVTVRLERIDTGSSGSSVAAYVDEHRVGTLAHTDGLRYLPAISAGRERGERGLLTLGLSTVEHDGRLRLRIAPTQ